MAERRKIVRREAMRANPLDERMGALGIKPSDPFEQLWRFQVFEKSRFICPSAGSRVFVNRSHQVFICKVGAIRCGQHNIRLTTGKIKIFLEGLFLAMISMSF
jgi:hypothetical protein